MDDSVLLLLNGHVKGSPRSVGGSEDEEDVEHVEGLRVSSEGRLVDR